MRTHNSLITLLTTAITACAAPQLVRENPSAQTQQVAMEKEPSDPPPLITEWEVDIKRAKVEVPPLNRRRKQGTAENPFRAVPATPLLLQNKTSAVVAGQGCIRVSYPDFHGAGRPKIVYFFAISSRRDLSAVILDTKRVNVEISTGAEQRRGTPSALFLTTQRDPLQADRTCADLVQDSPKALVKGQSLLFRGEDL
jgi:hypothetical protein